MPGPRQVSRDYNHMKKVNYEDKPPRLPLDPFSGKLENIFAAVKCEESGFVLESIEQYSEGIKKLQELVKEQPSKKAVLMDYIESYQLRLKILRNLVFENITSGRLIETKNIKSGERGYGYYRILANYLNNDVKEIHVYESKLHETFQLQHFVCFLETVAKNCRYLKYVRVFTRNHPQKTPENFPVYQKIVKDLKAGNVFLIFRFLHRLIEPKIILSNGIIIHIRHGLHFYQEPYRDEVCLGSCDYDFRKCQETKIEVWKSQPFAESLKDMDHTKHQYQE